MDRHPTRTRRALTAIAVCSVLAALLIRCHGEPPEEGAPVVEVRCVASSKVAIDETLSLRGRLAPPPGGDLAVASQVAGKITRVNVREGQHVGSGDVVATVDDAASRDGVRQAEAALSQARSNATNSEALLKRTEELVLRGIAARQELEDAKARAESARAAVGAASASTDLARRTLGRVQVRSSLEGVVTRVMRGPGALVDGTSATPVVQLASTGATEFVADATERELSTVDAGQSAEVTIFGPEAKLRGTVRMRASALDPATGLGTVRIALDALPAGLPVGAYGQVSIVTRHRDDVRVLPSAALRGAVLDGAEIVVCKGGKAEVRKVQVGYRDDERFEVVNGLAADERAATDHVLGLESGSPIREAK